jgi:hypothetical protein
VGPKPVDERGERRLVGGRSGTAELTARLIRSREHPHCLNRPPAQCHERPKGPRGW